MTDGAPGDGRAVIAEYLRRAAALDPESYAELWAVDGRLEMPFHPDERAREIVGRAAIRDRMATARATLAELRWIEPVIRATDEPGTYLIETRSEARRCDGSVYRNRYVILASVQDGQMVRWREYFDPTALPGSLSAHAGEPIEAARDEAIAEGRREHPQ